MANHEQLLKSPKIRLWRYLPILIILGLAVHPLVPQITTLESSWSVVKGMAWWAVALAAVAEVLSYLGSGFMLHTILDTNQQKLSTLEGTLITMASFSIGLVTGGWVGGAAATYGWVHRENYDSNTAILAGTLPAMLNNGFLAGVALIGTLYLLVVHDLSQTQLIEFGMILLVLGLITFGIMAALRFLETATGLAVRLASRRATLRHMPFEPEKNHCNGDTIRHCLEFPGRWQMATSGARCHCQHGL